MRGKRIAWFFIMIVLGIAAGLVYGWVINPVKYEDTSPAMLRSDYKADYVLMVAEIYHADQNLEQAARRLSTIDSLPPSRVVVSARIKAKELGYAAQDLEMMDGLAQALMTASTTATPTLGGKP